MSTDKPLLHSSDRALLDAAAGRGETVVLTPDMLKGIMASLDDRKADIAARFPQIVVDCPYETRLAVTAQVFKAIVDHAGEGGTFRYLIYERLGFENDAYVPLYLAGGMVISNEFELKPPMVEMHPGDLGLPS